MELAHATHRAPANSAASTANGMTAHRAAAAAAALADPADARKHFACEYCPKKFNLRRTYQRHVVEKHRVKFYRCKICDKEFNNRQVLKEHCERNHQEERVPCLLCQKTFTTKSSLRLHHDAIHKGIRYKCKHCEKSFGQLGSLRRHVNTIHDGLAMPVKIDIAQARMLGQPRAGAGAGASPTASHSPKEDLSPPASPLAAADEPRSRSSSTTSAHTTATAHDFVGTSPHYFRAASPGPAAGDGSIAAASDAPSPRSRRGSLKPVASRPDSERPELALEDSLAAASADSPAASSAHKRALPAHMAEDASSWHSYQPMTKRVRLPDISSLMASCDNMPTEVGPSECAAIAILVSMKA